MKEEKIQDYLLLMLKSLRCEKYFSTFYSFVSKNGNLTPSASVLADVDLSLSEHVVKKMFEKQFV